MKKKAMIIILSGVFISLFLLACQSNTPDSAADVRTAVSLSPVEKEEMSKEIHTYGRLAAKKEMKLSFKIPGIIESINADEGEKVAAGQLLAQLNLSEIDSQVKQAESAYEKAERDLSRVKNLYQEKAATLEQLQNTQTAYQVAQSGLNAARFNKKYSSIRAPSDGRILRKLMEENEMAGAGYPVFVFASTESDWIVRTGISDRDLVRVRLGDPAVITFDAYPDTTFKGRIAEIAESADPMTGTYEIELRMEPSKQKFVSGFVAKIDISPSLSNLYFIIPVDALVEAQGRKGFVFTLLPETMTVQKISIEIGFLFDDKVAVISGLEDVKEVVTSGVSYLSDSQKIRIISKNE